MPTKSALSGTDDMGADQSRLQAVPITRQSPTALPYSLSATSSMPPLASRVTGVPRKHRRAETHFRFLDLPPEIRNIIYKQLLVVGKICYPELDSYGNRHQKDSGYKKPQLALLRVCKQIHREAEPLYLSMNLFELPNKFKDYRPFCEPGRDAKLWKTRRFLFSEAAYMHVRNISFAFTSNPGEVPNYRDEWVKYHSDRMRILWTKMSDRQRRDIMHQQRLDDAIHHWIDLQLSLCLFQCRMDYVQVDFSDTYCPSGCCRTLDACTHCWILPLQPKVLNVSGLLEGEKKGFTCMEVRTGELVRYEVDVLKDRFGLRFMRPGEVTRWDRYRLE